jgi:hypothetical protein
MSRRHIPEYVNPQKHRFDNLKSQIKICFSNTDFDVLSVGCALADTICGMLRTKISHSVNYAASYFLSYSSFFWKLLRSLVFHEDILLEKLTAKVSFEFIF